MATNIIIVGCLGRMGQRIISLGLAHPEITVGGVSERADHTDVGTELRKWLPEAPGHLVIKPGLGSVIDAGNVIIDFTSPAATLEHVAMAVKHGKRMVIGTTGLTADQEKHISAASREIAIVYSPNMSLGVNLLLKLCQLVGRSLSDDYDVEIVEAHHRFKKDAPSGTARALAQAVAAARDIDLASQAVYGRVGMCGERKRGDIGIHAVRGGDVVGEHTVSFMAEGERVELTHRASSRDAFARGALAAAQFAADKPRGLFSMQDVLGFTAAG